MKTEDYSYRIDPQQAKDLYVYKIFAPTVLTVKERRKLFRWHKRGAFDYADWKAYPNYDEVPTDAKVNG